MLIQGLQKFSFLFCTSKMYLMLEGYINAEVDFLKIRKTDKNWVSTKNAYDGLGVKNISDLGWQIWKKKLYKT